MKKVLATATAVALVCSGVVSTTTATAQESGTFADQFQPERGITAGHYYTVHAPVFGSDIGGWMDRFENVKIGEAPFPGVNAELVTSPRALPVVELSLTGGKIYPREFKIPVSGTVYYKDGSSEEVATHLTVLPNNNTQKPREPNVPPWTPSYEDNSSGSSDEGGHIAETVLWALVSVASLAVLGVIFHLAPQENPFPGLLFMNRDK